jgi:hypothetical protein
MRGRIEVGKSQRNQALDQLKSRIRIRGTVIYSREHMTVNVD